MDTTLILDPRTANEVDPHERQIRLFGADGQARIKTAKVCVVGCGGLGSHVVQQLAHAGASDFLLIDPDTPDVTSSNRLVGLRADDLPLSPSKVEVAKRLVLAIPRVIGVPRRER